MPKYRDLNHLDILPASFLDALQEFIGVAALQFRITAVNPTTIRGVAGAGPAQSALALDGLWRYRSSNHDVAHVSGSAGTYDIYAYCSANSFSNSPVADTDNTDYNWYLASRATGSPPTGNTPAGNAINKTVKVGETTWDGAAITEIRQLVGNVPVEDGLVGTASLRTLGTGARQAMPGNQPAGGDTTGTLSDLHVTGIHPSEVELSPPGPFIIVGMATINVDGVDYNLALYDAGSD